MLRARADGRLGGVVSVGPFEEFDGDDRGDGEGELSEACFGVAVGAAAQLLGGNVDVISAGGLKDKHRTILQDAIAL